MSVNAPDSLIGELVGAEVESVVFVRDYLQITLFLPEFSPRLSFYAWPVATTPEGVTHSSGSAGYRDAVCGLIDCQVVGAGAQDQTGLLLEFNDGWFLTVRPAWSELAGPEIAMLQMNDEASRWDVWRPGEAPFETDRWTPLLPPN